MPLECFRIQIFPEYVPPEWDNGAGAVDLDLNEEVGLGLQKIVQELDELGNLKTNYDLPLTLPNSSKNWFYLKQFYDANSGENVFAPIACMVIVGSKVIDEMVLRAEREGDDGFDVILKKSSNDWTKGAEDLLISSLQLGQFELTEAELMNNWDTGQDLYNDGDDGYWFPLINYGKTLRQRQISTEDFRPWLHWLSIVQKGCEEIGWCFRSSFFETDFGRRIITYHLRDDYGNTEEERSLREFVATKSLEIGDPLNQIVNWVEDYDAGNNFFPPFGIYSANMTGDFKLDISCTNPTGIGFTVRVEMRKNGTEVVGEVEFLVNENSTASAEILVENVTLAAGDELTVWIPADEPGITTFLPFEFLWQTVNVKSTIFQEGDTIVIADMVDPELTLMDVLKGGAHMCNGKIFADGEKRELWLRPAFAGEIEEDAFEGHYLEDVVDLGEKLECDSGRSELPLNSRARWYVLGWRQSTDAAVKALDLPDDEPLYSKTIDLGSQYRNETFFNRNPLYEPSVEGVWAEIAFYTQFLPSPPLRITRLWDNEGGDAMSFNLGSRALVTVGKIVQQVDIGDVSSGNNLLAAGVIFNGNFMQEIPFATMKTSSYQNGQLIDRKLIYGDEEGDLFSIAWARWIAEILLSMTQSYLVDINIEDFWGYTLRERFAVRYKGQQLFGRVTGVRDFKPCRGLTTPIDFVPERQSSDVCFDVSDPADGCDDQNVFIDYVFNEATNCYTFTLIGLSLVCKIDTVTWEYKLATEGASGWTVIGSGDMVEVCDQTEAFDVRALVEFDAVCPCPDVTPIVRVDPCGNEPECILTEFVDAFGENCVEFTLGGTMVSDYALTVFYDDGINGLTEIPDAPYEVCGFADGQTITFTITVTPLDGCPEINLECEITIGFDDFDCGDNDVTLICLGQDVGGLVCYTWALGGTISDPDGVQLFIVNWECADGSAGQWSPGDRPICCEGQITATAVVITCNCGIICTDEVICDGGCDVPNLGNAVPLAVCA